MTLPSLPAPVVVARPPEFERMLADLRASPIIAVDTESNSLFAYREQVCLIQFSTETLDYLLDPLALRDLSALGPIFADPAVEKVFHAGEYDLICLKRDYGFSFANLFDTMLAVRILGRAAVGLASVLEAEFGVKLNKRFQRANWGQRPLSAEMLDYARWDSHYLIALRHKLRAELEAAGRLELADEDFKHLCRVTLPEANGDCWLRAAGGHEITPRQAAVLNELCAYREQRAKQANLPVFKVLSNDALFALACAEPLTREDLAAAGILNQRLQERHAAGLLEAVKRGIQAAPLHRPRRSRPAQAYIDRIEALRNWRKEKGKELGVESDVVLPRDLMEALALAGPRTMAELSELMADFPWRLRQYGGELLEQMQKKS